MLSLFVEPRSSGGGGAVRGGDVRVHGTNCPGHTLTQHFHYPPPRTQPTFWYTEGHLPHGFLQVLSLWLEGKEHWKPLQQPPGVPRTPAQLVYRAKGGGKGYWHDMPSIGQAHGAHGWHSCLNGLGRESYCPAGPRGTGIERRGGGLKYSRAERRSLTRRGLEHP